MAYGYGFGDNNNVSTGAKETLQNDFPIGDKLTNGGVQVRYLEANGAKLKFQVKTFNVTSAGQRIGIDFQTLTTNDRILGVVMTSSEAGIEDKNKVLNDCTMQLLIDDEEIFPTDFDTSLISAKNGKSFYENIYPVCEKAAGSLVKGTIIVGTKNYTSPVDLKLILWTEQKKK